MHPPGNATVTVTVARLVHDIYWAEEAVVAMTMVINLDAPTQQKVKVPQSAHADQIVLKEDDYRWYAFHDGR